MLYARITLALGLLLQPADGLLLSAATIRAPVTHLGGFALSPLAAPRSSIIEMGRVRALVDGGGGGGGEGGGGGGQWRRGWWW